jgi:hypothetical protein
LIALLTSLRERITALEDRIAQALAAHADASVFTSLPGSGTLLAEIGDATNSSREMAGPRRSSAADPGFATAGHRAVYG